MSQPPQLLRQSLGIRIDSEQDWDEVARDAELANQIVDRIPVLKAAKLNEVGSFQTICAVRSLERQFGSAEAFSPDILSSPHDILEVPSAQQLTLSHCHDRHTACTGGRPGGGSWRR